MAEFNEVMKQLLRMCKSYKECENCELYVFNGCSFCPNDAPEMTERIIMEWAAAHPELHYPTWAEWQKSNFPDAYAPLYPCNFARCPRAYSECNDCELYRDSEIPADIARKLGIQPITEA